MNTTGLLAAVAGPGRRSVGWAKANLPLVFTLVVAVAFLTACSIFARVSDPNTNNATVYGSQPLSNNEQDKPIDLPTLIAPPAVLENLQAEAQADNSSDEWKGVFDTGLFDGKIQQPDQQYETRLADAYHRFNELPDQVRKERRAEIQEALIGKSTNLCNLYKKQVMQIGTTQNLYFGDATTLLSGLAATFSSIGVVRPLAASGAVASGFRSEFNSDVFANLNLQVITAGIEKRRSEYYAAILKTRSCSIQEYPLEEAVKDAFYFHASCSLYSGLEEANLSIHQAQSPGPDMLARDLQQAANVIAAARSAFGETAISSSTKIPFPSAAPSDAATSTFSATPTTQHVSETCELPIPGTPRAPVQPASASTVVTSDGKSLTMPFSGSADPVIALGSARKHVSDTVAELTKQYKATLPTGPITPAPGAQPATDDTVDALVKSLSSAGEIAKSRLDYIETHEKPTDAMNAYNIALVKLESDDTKKQGDSIQASSSSGAQSSSGVTAPPPYLSDVASLESRQVENTRISKEIESVVNDFDSGDAVTQIKAPIVVAKQKAQAAKAKK